MSIGVYSKFLVQNSTPEVVFYAKQPNLRAVRVEGGARTVSARRGRGYVKTHG